MAWVDTRWEPVGELKVPAHEKAESHARDLVVMGGDENLAAVGTTQRAAASFDVLLNPVRTLLVDASGWAVEVGVGLYEDARESWGCMHWVRSGWLTTGHASKEFLLERVLVHGRSSCRGDRRCARGLHGDLVFTAGWCPAPGPSAATFTTVRSAPVLSLAMDERGILYVVLPEDELDFEERAAAGWSVSDIVDGRRWALQRRHPAIVIVAGDIAFLAVARRGQYVTTRKRRLTLSRISEVARLPLERVIERMPSRHARHIRELAGNGGVVPPGAWSELLNALYTLVPDAEQALHDIPPAATSAISPAEQVRSEERDAVLLSLSLAGLRREVTGIPTPADAHFLQGVDYLVREDALLVHDAHLMPGFEFAREYPGTAVQFTDASGSRSVTVMNINRTPLELTTGVDLIYYRHDLDAFVLVQYKRLLKEGGRWIYRPKADRGFAKEVERMESLIPFVGPPTRPGEFRLSSRPFFIKLCRPGYLDQSEGELVRGMYIPLDYWKLLASRRRSGS